MPQLWTETFVSQYSWLLIILLTFYYFVTTTVIPKISETIKARQVQEATEGGIATDKKDNSGALFNDVKQKTDASVDQLNFEVIQNDWLNAKPEDNAEYWASITANEEAEDELNNYEEDSLSLEEFVKDEKL